MGVKDGDYGFEFFMREYLSASPERQKAARAAGLAALRLDPDKATTVKPVEMKIVDRREVARRLGVSLRTVDSLTTAGSLKRVRLPGRARGVGILESSIDALITTGLVS